MTIVADSGPLIALAKVDGLGILFDLYPRILTSQAVYDETVQQGHLVRAADASQLEYAYETQKLRIEPLPDPVRNEIEHLGLGERESIQLALGKHADWLLVDDFEARQAALETFENAHVPTRVKGTLGVITSAFVDGLVSIDAAIQKLTTLRSRDDIWISSELCQQVELTLKQLSQESS